MTTSTLTVGHAVHRINVDADTITVEYDCTHNDENGGIDTEAHTGTAETIAGTWLSVECATCNERFEA